MVRLDDKIASRYPYSDHDVRLMLLVKQGSTRAFDTLWQRYHDRVQSLLIHLLGSQRLTEDLAQEVFMRVYRARATYVPTAKFSTWLFTIVNNVVSNARRSLAVRREIQLTSSERFRGSVLDHRLTEPVEYVVPEQKLARDELGQVMHQAIDQLNDRQRTAILLCNFEDLSHAEAAQIMGTTADAIKSLLHRARTSLRAKLESYVDDGCLATLQNA